MALFTNSLGLTEFDAALKEYYTVQELEQTVYSDRPFLGLVEKSKKFGGRKLPIPIQFGGNQAISATFSTASTAAGTSAGLYEQFELTRARLYGICTIDTELAEASADKLGAWVEASTQEIDGQINAVSNVLASALYRVNGEVGQVASFTTDSTIILANTADIHNIEVGMVLKAYSAISGGSVRTTNFKVTGVNRNTGVITTAGVSGTTGTLQNNDWLFPDGNYGLSVSGLQAWAPYGGPSATAFFGVDRTVDSRLGGLYYNGSSDSVSDAIITAVNRQAAMGVKPTHAFCSFGQFAKLVKAQTAAQRIFEKGSGTATVGFEGVVILGPKGPVKVFPDQYCPDTRAFTCDMSKIKLYTMGEPVHIIDNDGLTVLRDSSKDALTCRIGFKGNLGVSNPMAICTINLAASGVI